MIIELTSQSTAAGVLAAIRKAFEGGASEVRIAADYGYVGRGFYRQDYRWGYVFRQAPDLAKLTRVSWRKMCSLNPRAWSAEEARAIHQLTLAEPSADLPFVQHEYTVEYCRELRTTYTVRSAREVEGVTGREFPTLEAAKRAASFMFVTDAEFVQNVRDE